MMQYMPELLLVPAIIGIIYLIYVRMQYDCEITILQKKIDLTILYKVFKLNGRPNKSLNHYIIYLMAIQYN